MNIMPALFVYAQITGSLQRFGYSEIVMGSINVKWAPKLSEFKLPGREKKVGIWLHLIEQLRICMSSCNSQLYSGKIRFFFLPKALIKFPAETTLSSKTCGVPCSIAWLQWISACFLLVALQSFRVTWMCAVWFQEQLNAIHCAETKSSLTELDICWHNSILHCCLNVLRILSSAS